MFCALGRYIDEDGDTYTRFIGTADTQMELLTMVQTDDDAENGEKLLIFELKDTLLIERIVQYGFSKVQ